MAFTVSDLQELLRLLGEQPQWRAQFRTLLVTDSLQVLPERFDRLTEVVEELAEAQRRTEERLEQLAEAQRRTEERLEQLAEAQRRTEERLEQLAEAQRRTEERLEQLAEAQRRTEERLEQLAEAQRRTEERLERLEAAIQALVEAQRRTDERLERVEAAVQSLAEQVQALVTWQRGEVGRREGERYERLLVKRAPALFNGGQGGATDEPFVQQRLMELLRPLPALDILADDENPFLADLIWWKDGQFAVVEASLRVNGQDVVRAARRTETLQKANVQVMGIVIGEEWVGPDTRQWAEARGVQWRIGEELSEGLLTFLRLAAGRP